MRNGSLADRLDDLLPQTQCGRCGYAGCRPYAEAMARGESDINRCPPGGTATVEALAGALGVRPRPVDPACGEVKAPAVAVIDEAWCIGCTLCLQACPVDAILGAAKQMHTVVGAECTGCELCLEPCPTDCIRMVPLPEAEVPAPYGAAWREAAARARRRHQARQARLAALRRGRVRPLSRTPRDDAAKKAVVAAAVARVRARWGGAGGGA